MRASLVERYLRLGLQVGRHVDGIVDAYYGPAELAAAVESEPPVEPRALAAALEDLLGELDDGWLRDQVAGLRTYAGVLAGEALSYADEVEGCYGVRPRRTDEAVFAAAHAQLEELLPGGGPLGERHERWRRGRLVPAARMEDVLAAVIAEARAQTRALVELPEGEDVELETVHDEPWMAFCDYHGGLRSGISVNVDLPQTGAELLHLALHETYPGHHAERSCKEQLLVRGRGMLEESLALVPTPQSVVSEGIAELAPALVLDGEGGEALAGVVRAAGIDLDLRHARAVEEAQRPCRWAEVNAALMLHDEGKSTAEAQAYLERWALMAPKLSAHLVRFLQEPTSRTYVLAYPAGRELCQAYVDGERGRFRRLLTEQVRVADLVAGPAAG
jgi:hypothetical protein